MPGALRIVNVMVYSLKMASSLQMLQAVLPRIICLLAL